MVRLDAGETFLDPAPPNDEQGWWYGKAMSVPATADGEQAYLHEEMRREVRRAAIVLPPVAGQVLCVYFGLANGEPMTLEPIGTPFRRSRERIQQVKQRPLQRLSVHSRGRQDYLVVSVTAVGAPGAGSHRPARGSATGAPGSPTDGPQTDDRTRGTIASLSRAAMATTHPASAGSGMRGGTASFS